MKISILGATGRTGQMMVERALANGHQVKALVRRPEGLTVTDINLEIVVGDARDPEIIEDLVDGQDAVICSLGIPASGSTPAEIDDSERPDVCLVSTKLLFGAMVRHNVARIVLMSTHSAGASNDGSDYSNWLRDLVKNRINDKDDMEAFIAASDAPLKWTVIRNPEIYEGEKGRDYDVYTQITFDRSSQITYADLADFAVSEVEEPQHVGQFLSITEPLDNKGFMQNAKVATTCSER
jgi:uncharacterized protein YbjT (DUF2867 family)